MSPSQESFVVCKVIVYFHVIAYWYSLTLLHLGALRYEPISEKVSYLGLFTWFLFSWCILCHRLATLKILEIEKCKKCKSWVKVNLHNDFEQFNPSKHFCIPSYVRLSPKEKHFFKLSSFVISYKWARGRVSRSSTWFFIEVTNHWFGNSERKNNSAGWIL